MGDDMPIYEDWATDYAALGDELLAHAAAMALLRGAAVDRHLGALAASCLIPQHLDDLQQHVLQRPNPDPAIIAAALGEMADEVAALAQGDPAARRAVASLRALAAQPAHAGEASAAFLRAFAGWGEE